MIRVKIPATSANLGPGLDCLGLSLQLYNILTVEPKQPFNITLTGSCCAGISPREDNLLWRTMRHFWDLIHYPAPSVALTLESNIPPARGLGSSSSAIVGGLAAANALAGSPCSKYELLQIAAKLEGHPDNVTPALYGGVTLAVPTQEGIWPRVLNPAPKLKAVVVIPSTRLNTKKSRGILSPRVSRSEAVFNIAHAGLLIEAFLREDYSLLREGMRDALHQNQRAVLLPGLPETLEAALQAGAYGAALSGSGPTLIALLAESAVREVSAQMLDTLEQYGVQAQAQVLAIDSQGVQVSQV